MEQQVKSSRSLCIHLFGSIDVGHFDSCNDVYLKYSIVFGPDWILSSGSDVGVSQISRYRQVQANRREFVWNQPVSASFRSYNCFGWPQIILCAYYFDTFGNDQILGYGCAYLPVSSFSPSNTKQIVTIYAPQSTSTLRRFISWILGRKPELIASNLFARGDCRSLLHMDAIGEVELSFNMISSNLANNGYKS